MSAIDLDHPERLELPVEIPDRPETVHANHWSPPVKVLYAVLKAVGPHVLSMITPEQLTGYFSKVMVEVDRAVDPSGSELELFIKDTIGSHLDTLLQIYFLERMDHESPLTRADVESIAERIGSSLADHISYGLGQKVSYYADEFDTNTEPLQHWSRRGPHPLAF